MISFSTELFDLLGDVLVQDNIPSDTGQDDLSRRVTRTKTLNGGVVIDDSGYAAGDRTINVVITDPTEAVVRNVQRLVQQYSSFVVCTAEGAFKAVTTGMAITTEGFVRIEFLVKSDA